MTKEEIIEKQKKLRRLADGGVDGEKDNAQRLGCKIYNDGNAWCCLYGENIQEGICGWGDNPYLSALDFRKEFMGEKGGDQ